MQGPYYLTGKGEQDFIQPVNGTVKVHLNGRALEEGSEKDFVVDYELGTITFTPKVLIKDEDLMRVEYEYKTFNYQRTLLGTTAGVALADSLLSVQGVLWSESDNKNYPIDLTLTSAETDSLRQAGDRLPFASTARPVQPNDVARESELYPLYRKSYDAASKDSFFVYDSLHHNAPDSVLGYYNVWFRHVNSGEKGNYSQFFADQRGWIYRYTKDTGSYTDLSPIPAPERRTSGELMANLRLKNLSATLNVAGQDNDHNLFSSKDDNDNQASATSFSFLAGSRARDRVCAWLAGSHRFTSARFDAEGLSAYDRKEQWDDVTLTEQPQERQLWDATAGATVVPGLETSVSYGQDRVAAQLVTDKISPSMQYAWKDRFSLDYNGSFFRHLSAADKGLGRRENGDARLSFPRHIFGLLYRDEWRSDSLGSGSGLYEGGAQYDFAPLHLHEQLSYVSMRKSLAGHAWSADTGYSLRWEQAIDRALLPSWHVGGSSSMDRSVTYGADRTTTLLVDLTSDVTPKTGGFTSHQHYRTSSEQASAFIQVPIFAGKGMGTHVYDSILKEYVPHTPGDYFMKQQEVYDQGSDLRVRKTTADLSWSFRPTKPVRGILNDLAWQGTLLCEEHVDAATTRAPSWAPGYLSLSSLMADNSINSAVRYADLSYRQDVNWQRRADSGAAEKATGRLMVTPAYRIIRGYRESSVESRLETERPVKRFSLGAAVNLLSLVHADTSGAGDLDYSLADRRLELSQKYRLLGSVTLSLLEVAGTAQKYGSSASAQSLPLDSTFYYQIVPGLSWQPGSKGSLQATYTYSVVPLTGDIDYRMARGFQGGVSHQANISADIKMGERFTLIGSYRGDVHKALGAPTYEPANNVFSLEVRAYM